MTVYMLWMNDCVLNVFKSYRLAFRAAERLMADPQYRGRPESCWTGWVQSSEGRARWHNREIARLEIEPRGVRRSLPKEAR